MDAPPATLPPAAPYDCGTMLLHWLHAVLILGLIGLGLYMAGLPKGEARSAAIGLHKSFGVLAFALVAVRLAWRLRHPPPADARLTAAEHRLAAAGHRLLYALLVLVPLAGYLSSSFTRYPMRVFGVVLPKAGREDEALNAFFNATHGLLAWTLAALIAAHLGAVALHALQGKPVLARMLPGRQARG
ncbi:cytochrome b [Thauera sinica]|uniref:Cytochrome b n=1 Tax=Thauera sinica TaxID=2665146 RepID=A0ABW1APV2_9RHOO|nr:cytochrome b [Thauera sp. K11]ATE62502.1 cytochrome B [Thauera sp. K11]